MAFRPHEAKSSSGNRDISVDSAEPQWWTTSRSSPPSRRWDVRLQQDGSPHESRDAPNIESSLSSQSKRSGSQMNSDQHSIHQYSVSDGEFPYLGSPSHNFKVPRWTHSVQKNDNLEITPTRGLFNFSI